MSITKETAFSPIRDHHDLLAAMPAVLGYRPSESVVVAVCDEKVLVVTLRVDIDWFTKDFEIVSEHLIGLRAKFPEGRIFLLSYTKDLTLAELSCTQIIEVIGEVCDALSTNGDRWWSLLCTGECCPAEGHPFNFQNALVTAEAVLAGVPVMKERSEVIQCVAGPGQEDIIRLEQIFTKVAKELEDCEPEQHSQMLSELTSVRDNNHRLSEYELAQLAVLLDNKQLFDEFSVGLTIEESAGVLDRLLQVCASCPPAFAQPVLAALVWAAWLSGGGAVLSAGLDRLNRVAPENFILHSVGLLLANLVSPKDWASATR